MHYQDFLPRTQDGRIKIQEPLAIACLCPKVPRAQVQDPKEPLEISVQRSQGKDILAVFHIFGGEGFSILTGLGDILLCICFRAVAKIIPDHQCPTGGAMMATGRTLTSASALESLDFPSTPPSVSWRRSLASLGPWRSVRLCWMDTVVVAEASRSSTSSRLMMLLKHGRH